MLSLVCSFFFFLACDQHRANQHCPDRSQGFCNPPREERKLILQDLTCALLDSDRSTKTALTADEKRYLVVYIY
ncbi:unnamed protein product [Staurois parvus]|uniref:Secreted protein n=1 Tax=Staurois parvus TaxID=386267 RepID=A0ABN9BS21_9NEOB|nr:unnamed protein product [Staurois parvus]